MISLQSRTKSLIAFITLVDIICQSRERVSPIYPFQGWWSMKGVICPIFIFIFFRQQFLHFHLVGMDPVVFQDILPIDLFCLCCSVSSALLRNIIFQKGQFKFFFLDFINYFILFHSFFIFLFNNVIVLFILLLFQLHIRCYGLCLYQSEEEDS